jgi:hypothetical protein
MDWAPRIWRAPLARVTSPHPPPVQRVLFLLRQTGLLFFTPLSSVTYSEATLKKLMLPKSKFCDRDLQRKTSVKLCIFLYAGTKLNPKKFLIILAESEHSIYKLLKQTFYGTLIKMLLFLP